MGYFERMGIEFQPRDRAEVSVPDAYCDRRQLDEPVVSAEVGVFVWCRAAELAVLDWTRDSSPNHGQLLALIGHHLPRRRGGVDLAAGAGKLSAWLGEQADRLEEGRSSSLVQVVRAEFLPGQRHREFNERFSAVLWSVSTFRTARSINARHRRAVDDGSTTVTQAEYYSAQHTGSDAPRVRETGAKEYQAELDRVHDERADPAAWDRLGVVLQRTALLARALRYGASYLHEAQPVPALERTLWKTLAETGDPTSKSNLTSQQRLDTWIALETLAGAFEQGLVGVRQNEKRDTSAPISEDATSFARAVDPLIVSRFEEFFPGVKANTLQQRVLRARRNAVYMAQQLCGRISGLEPLESGFARLVEEGRRQPDDRAVTAPRSSESSGEQMEVSIDD